MHQITVANKRDYPKSEGAVYVGRPTVLGNPYPLAKDASPEERARVIRQYREWLEAMLSNPSSEQARVFAGLRARALEGDLTLVCWCKPLACHADVIADLLRESLPLTRPLPEVPNE